MQQETAQTVSPEVYVEKIQNGQESYRETLIGTYRPFILSVVNRFAQKSAAQGDKSDEFSIALNAFNEAINKYNPDKNSSFISFCDLLINRRLIDYFRQNKKHFNTYPFTYYEAINKKDAIDKALSKNQNLLSENYEIKEEIMLFKKRLKCYGIEFSGLIRSAPKHVDSKILCIKVAKKIIDNAELSEKLEKTKRLPIKELLNVVSLHRKTLEKNRKYIIILYIILTSGMETIKGYIRFMEEGVHKI